MREKLLKRSLILGLFFIAGPAFPQTHFLDLSKAANRSPSESFDQAYPGAEDVEKKEGFGSLPLGSVVFRGVPFQIVNPAENEGRSFIALRGRSKPDFPEAVSIPAGGVRAAYLYFLQTCRWGGTAPDIKVAEYDIVYDDGQVEVVPLRVGVELSNFFGSDDTAASFLAWWHSYKNIDMGVNFYPWKNPYPDKSIQTILFKSLSKMPVPILFAITASDKELPVSPVSPKPEKGFQTETSKWNTLKSSDGSSSGTALDMSFLLDAPAGKHGAARVEGEKLVFGDGTPARFWGIRLPADWETWDAAKASKMADEIADHGCNLVLAPPEKSDPAGAGLTPPPLLAVFKNKGIYVCWDDESVSSTPTPTVEDSAFISSSLLSWGRAHWNEIAESQTPFSIDDRPMVLEPESSLEAQGVSSRSLGTPFGLRWAEGWPNQYMAETPVLISAFSLSQGWSAVVGGVFDDSESEGTVEPGEKLGGQSPVWLQWPVAALAFLRGDLKEGKIFVLPKKDVTTGDFIVPLRALAHKSGWDQESGKYRTDQLADLKAKVNPKQKSFVSDSGQLNWQGNVGLVEVTSLRFQAFLGFLGHRKLHSPVWSLETSNSFAAISLISLTDKSIALSSHLLLTGVTRMENTSMVYNASKTKILSIGKAPVLVEPLSAKIVIYRFKKDPALKARALDAHGSALRARVPFKWVNDSLVISWVPGSFYLEIYK